MCQATYDEIYSTYLTKKFFERYLSVNNSFLSFVSTCYENLSLSLGNFHILLLTYFLLNVK